MKKNVSGNKDFRIILRIRDYLKSENAKIAKRNSYIDENLLDENKIKVQKETIEFDDVYAVGKCENQIDIYEKEISGNLKNWILSDEKKYANINIFACGCYQSGKSFTLGINNSSEEPLPKDWGILPRLLTDLEREKKTNPNVNYTFSVEFYELIYMNKINITQPGTILQVTPLAKMI